MIMLKGVVLFLWGGLALLQQVKSIKIDNKFKFVLRAEAMELDIYNIFHCPNEHENYSIMYIIYEIKRELSKDITQV